MDLGILMCMLTFAFFGAACKEATDKNDKKMFQEVLTNFPDTKSLVPVIPLFNVQLAKDKDKAKLTFAFRGELSIFEPRFVDFVSCMKGAQVRHGRAPRGEEERQVQERLDRLLKE